MELKGKVVKIFEYVKKYGEQDEYVCTNKEYKESGRFLDFGVDYEEFESGAGNFSTALVLMDNGEVKNIEVTLIKF